MDGRAGPIAQCAWKTSHGKARRPRRCQDITDPVRVPSIWAIFAGGDGSRQKLAVQLLGQIDSPSSTQAPALLAIVSESGEVRGRSIETLRRRDRATSRRLWLGSCAIRMLDPDPILYRYFLDPVGWEAIGSPGLLMVRGPRYDVLPTYTVDESRVVFGIRACLRPHQWRVMKTGSCDCGGDSSSTLSGSSARF